MHTKLLRPTLVILKIFDFNLDMYLLRILHLSTSHRNNLEYFKIAFALKTKKNKKKKPYAFMYYYFCTLRNSLEINFRE